MARLWQSGFELNSITNGVEITGSIGSPTVQSTTVRTGTYALQVTSLSSGSAKNVNIVHGSTGVPLFVRFYFRYTTLPSVDDCIVHNQSGSNGIGIKITSTGTLKLFDEDGTIGSASSALSANTWYMVELQYDVSGGAGTHVAKARLEGSEFASSTTRSTFGSNTFYFGANLLSESNTAGNFYFDDIAINDNSGSYQNSYPGSGSIVHLRPNAAGDTNQWDTDAASGDSNNYTHVDEVTPNDVTDYVTWNTLNGTDEYNIDNFPGNSYDTINVVAVGYRGNRSVGTNSSAMVARLKATSGGTVTESSPAETATSTTWRTNDFDTNNAAPYELVSYTLPGTGTAWTKSTVDTAQIGARISTAGDRYLQLTAIWASVDYTPGTPPAANNSGFFGLM